MVVDPVLRVRRRVGRPVEPAQVGVVVAEQQVGRRAVGAGVQLPGQLAEARVVHRAPCRARWPAASGRSAPTSQDQVLRNHRWGSTWSVDVSGPGVGDPDLHEQVVRVVLGMRHVDHPVAVVVEHPGVEQLVLGLALVTAAVLGHEVGVRELRLRVVVAPPQPGVAGQGVEEPPVLLDVLAVVALRPGQAEHPLLEDRVPAVPERERHAQLLADVADAGHPVLAPAVGAGAGVVVREVVPGLAAGAVVLTHRPPGSLREVRAPLVPGRRLRRPSSGWPNDSTRWRSAPGIGRSLVGWVTRPRTSPSPRGTGTNAGADRAEMARGHLTREWTVNDRRHFRTARVRIGRPAEGSLGCHISWRCLDSGTRDGRDER